MADLMQIEQTKRIVKDSLWDETPEMGSEGLIATITDKNELMAALKRNIEQTKEKQRMKG